MKTVSDLEKRVWYRAVKVLYIIAYIIVISLVLFFAYDSKPTQVYDYDNSYIRCNSGEGKGNSYPLNKNNIFIYDGNLDEYDARDARKLCEYDKIGIGFDERNYPDPIITNYTFVPIYKTEGNWWSVVKYGSLGLIAVAFIFWLIKGIFYYIVVGNFSGHKREADSV